MKDDLDRLLEISVASPLARLLLYG